MNNHEKYFSNSSLEEIFNFKIIKNKSKGIDKRTHRSYSEKTVRTELFLAIQTKISSEKYRFSPYLELLRIKSRKSIPRMISIPTVRDKIVLQALKNYLHDFFPDCINKEQPNSYIRKLKNFIKINKNEEIFYLKTDIHQYYDTIDRKKLKKYIEEKSKNQYINDLVFSAIKNPTVPANYKRSNIDLYKLKKGIPQGLPISNILAQIYLRDFDVFIFEMIDKNTLYLRYVDDILILSTNECSDYLNNIKEKAKKLGLKLNTDKTILGKLSESIDFLGYLITDTNASISKQTIENQINKIAGKITWFKKGIENPNYRPIKYREDTRGFSKQFIKEVNEIITGSRSENKNYGWLFYYIEVDDISVFYKLDSSIAHMIKKIGFFEGKVPSQLKKTVTAYNEIKYNQDSNYINDYTKYKTVKQKEKLLKEFSQLNEQKDYSNEEIENLFEDYKNKKIKLLNEDIVY